MCKITVTAGPTYRVDPLPLTFRERLLTPWKRLRAAFDIRENNEIEYLRSSYPDDANTVQSNREIRWRNSLPWMARAPLISEVTSVQVSESSEGEWVVHLTTPSGNRTTLWLMGSGENVSLKVKSVSLDIGFGPHNLVKVSDAQSPQEWRL